MERRGSGEYYQFVFIPWRGRLCTHPPLLRINLPVLCTHLSMGRRFQQCCIESICGFGLRCSICMFTVMERKVRVEVKVGIVVH